MFCCSLIKIVFTVVAALLSRVNSVPLKVPPNSSPSEVQQVLSTSSLQYVYAFFRHGIRTPIKQPYPKDPNKKEFHKLFKGPPGELTKAGILEMYEVGERLKNIYGDFVGDFSIEKVQASSTETSRTIRSALSVMAGLFPPKKPLPNNLKWQPIPVWQDTRDFDKAYFYNDHDIPKLALKQCPKFGQMIEKGLKIAKSKDQDQSRNEIYHLLRENTGRDDVNSIDTGSLIYDILEMEKLNGLPLPKWATEPQPALGNMPLFPDLMRPILLDWFYKTQWLDRDPEMLSFYSGPLFYSINEKFNAKINKPVANKERFRYHNTHDDTILTLRWALGFDDPAFEVEPGDGIAFELHKLNDKYFVQVVYYNALRKEKEFGEVLKLRECSSSPCSYEEFSKQFPALSPQDWEKQCEITSPFLKTVQIAD